jgi:hypothetical protein
MGWVEDRFQNDSDFKKFVPQLWDAMRDSIGVAISEFNAHSEDASKKHLEAVDCLSMGHYCRRVTKGHGPSLEIFLQDKKRKLMVRQDGATFKEVCGYRIKRDRTGAEFFYEPSGTSVDIEVACRAALEIFIFGSLSNS